MPSNICIDDWWKCQEQILLLWDFTEVAQIYLLFQIGFEGIVVKERKCTIGAQMWKKWNLNFNPFLNLSHLQLISPIPGISLHLFPFEAALNI